MRGVIGVDVARVRGLYPTLATRTAQLDGSFAALQPESVIRAVIATLRAAPAQPGSRSVRSQQSATRVLRTRRAVADLTKANAEDVVLGHSVASLVQRFVALLAGDWQLGDEIVLSRLDSDLVARPLQRAARHRAVVVKWAEVDLDTGEVPSWQYDDLIGRRTRVVTIALANPATGMVPDVRAIADSAHARGALVIVDAAGAVPYLSLDLDELGADLLAVSGPAFGAPTVGAVVARAGLLSELSEADSGEPESPNFEAGPLPIELLDGFTAAVDHLADLNEQPVGSRRERLEGSADAAMAYTMPLYDRLDAALRSLPGVSLLGGPERSIPVAGFTVTDRSPDDIGAFLARRDVSVWTGESGVQEVLRAFGADELGGAAFFGVMPHTSATEIDQMIDAMRELTKT